MKRTRTAVAATIAFFAVSTTIALKANDDKSSDAPFKFQPNSLVLSRSVYTGDANTVTAGQTLPPGCAAGNVTVPLIAGGSNKVAVTCGAAIDNGEYPNLEDSHNVRSEERRVGK